ncbi:MAG: preprotein translocase subunit SecG, partial [Deltaproteobacteria bacterium]|nr:preprotein translocase subunit SecG [Deltaproteobacteria bacterium]
MTTIITSIHVFVAILLMISVLLQTGKGSGLGAAFGGSSSSVFGSRGPATLISRVTSVAAVIFMVTSLVLSLWAQGGVKLGSVVVADAPAAASAPASTEGRIVSEEDVQVPVGEAAAEDSASPAATDEAVSSTPADAPEGTVEGDPAAEQNAVAAPSQDASTETSSDASAEAT